MRLLIRLTTDGKFSAYFEGTHLYGVGNTKEEAIQDLIVKIRAVLKAIGDMQKEQ